MHHSTLGSRVIKKKRRIDGDLDALLEDVFAQLLELCLTESITKSFCKNQFSHKSVNLFFIVDLDALLEDVFAQLLETRRLRRVVPARTSQGHLTECI